MKRLNLLFVFLLCILTLQATGPKVLFIGDSITDGNWGGGGGSSSKRNHWDKNHLFGSGYMYLCAAYYQNNYPEREYLFFNRGISGNTLDDLEDRWEEDVIQINPDVLSVLIGTNDAGKYVQSTEREPFDFEGWEKKYRALLDRTLQANPKVKLVLASPFIANTGSMRKDTTFAQRNSMVRQYASIVERIAKDYKAVYLPYDQMYDEIFKTCPTSEDTYWIWDGIHPTAAAHGRMAKMWMKRVGKIIR